MKQRLEAALAAVKGKRGVTLAIAVAAVAFLALSVARCTSVHAQDETEPEQAQAEAVQEEAPIELTERQQEAIAAYGSDERELEALLEASAWVAQGASENVRFEGASWTEVRGDQEAARTYAICGIESEESDARGANGERSHIEERTATVLLDDGSYALVHVRLTTATGTQGTMASVASEAFTFAKSYVRAERATSFSVEGLNDEAIYLLGGDAQEITACLGEACALAYPTASCATWNGDVDVSWAKELATATFTLDNEAQTSIGVAYDMREGALTLAGGAL